MISYLTTQVLHRESFFPMILITAIIMILETKIIDYDLSNKISRAINAENKILIDNSLLKIILAQSLALYCFGDFFPHFCGWWFSISAFFNVFFM